MYSTHEGSGLAETERTIVDGTGTRVPGGPAVSGTAAQANQDSVREDVQSWLEDLRPFII